MTTTMTPNRFADTFGYPKGRAVTKLRDYMTAYVQEFIRQAPFVIMATSTAWQKSLDGYKGPPKR